MTLGGIWIGSYVRDIGEGGRHVSQEEMGAAYAGSVRHKVMPFLDKLDQAPLVRRFQTIYIHCEPDQHVMAGDRKLTKAVIKNNKADLGAV